MKSVTKILMVVVGVVTAVLQNPTALQAIAAFLGSHPHVATIAAGIGAAAALKHDPKSN